MQSSAMTLRADQAARRAVNLLLSGPAGGLMGARRVAAELGLERLLSFDMGGTSTDVALIDGRINLTSEGHIGPYPVAVPMVEMHTIGAGGGSIARIDEGGMLAVGPQSSGAEPGPACYGRGGESVTVTDANLVLGRLPRSVRLGGSMALDVPAAQRAVERLAGQMGMPWQSAAEGVIALANEHMAQALRVISVQRGIDPFAFTLAAFGGAGGLHVCALAEALQMRRALVPMHAGVLSALGMLVAPRGRQLSHAVGGLLEAQDESTLRAGFAGLVSKGFAELAEQAVAAADIELRYSVDLRYHGQSYTLNIPFESARQAERDFHRAHLQRFGHRLDTAVELVNLRVALSAPADPLPLEPLGAGGGETGPESVTMAGSDAPVALWRREQLPIAKELAGPVLVMDAVATTWVAPGWGVQRHASGSLLLERH
jgi:N-methylhydantoinase A